MSARTSPSEDDTSLELRRRSDVRASNEDTPAALFRHLVESVRDYAIFVLTPEGRIATWNIGAERIKGYEAGEIIGRHFSTFYPEDDIAAGKCEFELEAAIRNGRFEDEGWRVRKDGSRFWANVVISAMRDSDGNLLGFSKVTRDLTERKSVQDAQTARLAAEEANRTKDEFLAVLGHELRNPLAPILTALQLMKLRGDASSMKERQVIERQVRQMMHLVDDLLDISRITRGSVELSKRRIEIREIVAKAIETASPLLERRHHHFEIDFPEHSMLTYADETRLTQVFSNLLVNAAKYTPEGGHIRVRGSLDDGAIVVQVEDDGIGIEPGLSPKLFDLFVQGRQGTERANGGLGIGLTLVRTLIHLHGGSVQAESAGPGLGSTFTVRLPEAEPASDSAPPSREHPPLPEIRASLRVLIVDDNEDASTLLGDVLSIAGHEVETAADGAVALRLLHTFRPSVAILDIGLPVMDGYELATSIRAELGEHAPLLIALSGYGQKSDRERSRNAGFHAHLVKPVDALRVLELIDSLTGESAAESTASDRN